MRIPRFWALIIGLVTIWPVVYMIVFMASFSFLFLRMASEPAQDSAQDAFRYLMVAHFATMLVMIGLLVFYIVHLFKNVYVKDDRRVLWGLVLFMGAPVAMPVYWWVYLWHIPASRAADAQPGDGGA